MAETLLQKAQRLNIQPAGQPKESLSQKAERLGIKPQKKEGFLKTFAKDIVRPVVTLGARPFQLAKAFGGATKEEQAIDVPFFGKIETSRTKKDVIKDIGRGIETVSLGFGGGAAKSAIKQPIRAGIRAGAKFGAFGGFGAGLAREGELSEAIIGAGRGAVVGGALGGAIPAVSKGVRSVVGGVRKGIARVPKIARGVGQRARTEVTERFPGVTAKAVELGERVPRVAERVKTGFQKGAERAERISKSAPKVQQAIKANVDEDLIDFVVRADTSTRKGLKEITEIASKRKGVGIQERPGVVAGKSSASQYKIINQQKRNIGQKIGDAVKKLSRTQKVDMQKPVTDLAKLLQDQGVRFTRAKLNLNSFKGTNFTPQQRSKIMELWKLTTEGGRKSNPFNIWKKDNLFSKLQRESRFEGVSDIIVDLADGEKKNLFTAFRDVFRKTLDDVSPEDIRALNKQYRGLATFVDDIENSIVKSGKFESSKTVNLENFAQTNLRRIMSEAQSAGDFLNIARQMDTLSRELGYKGARPEDLISFAEAIKSIYPKSIPQTSFRGGIRASIKDVISTVADVGAPDVRDQQKALESLVGIKVKPKAFSARKR